MPRISQETITQVQRQISILDVISPVVNLKKSGHQYRGLSPFTSEKTASFYVNVDKNVWYCYSSNQGGGNIRFVELYDKLNFSESVEELARRFGIEVRYEEGATAPRESRSITRELFEIHDQACDYFHRAFKADHKESQWMRNYWTENRQFPVELADDYKIGFAPARGSRLPLILAEKGYTMEAIKKSGLFFFRDHETNPANFRMRFRGRLMIPIRDHMERVVAFTARQTDLTPGDDPSREAKYINSPETPIFSKGNLVFGLDRARREVGDESPFLLVEGQLDTLRCWQYGFKTAIAPQGTAITDAQMILLKRYISRIDCLLDGDRAGQKAALRMLPMALNAGHYIRFIVLPEGQDPDSLLLQDGADAVRSQIESGLTAMRFAVQALTAGKKMDAKLKSDVLRQIFEIIHVCDSEVVRNGYLEEVITILRVDERAARYDFRRFQRSMNRRKQISAAQNSGTTVQETRKERLTTYEYELLSLLLQNNWLTEPVSQVLDIDWIETDTLGGRILRRLIDDVREGLWEGLEKIENFLVNDEERNYIYSILAGQTDFKNPVELINECIKAITERYARKRFATIQMTIENTPYPSGGGSKAAAIRKKLVRLNNERKEIQHILKHPPELAT